MIPVEPGSYGYTVTATGFEPVTGQFTIENSDKKIYVTLKKIPDVDIPEKRIKLDRYNINLLKGEKQNL